jgi:predicted nucleic acid-binding protein
VLVSRLLLGRQSPVHSFFEQLATSDEMFAAQVLLPECTSVIRVEVFEARVTSAEGDRLIRQLVQLPLRLVDDPAQFSRAFELAGRFRHRKAYDMQYLAVAEIVGAELVTLDGGLRHAANTIGVTVHFAS